MSFIRKFNRFVWAPRFCFIDVCIVLMFCAASILWNDFRAIFMAVYWVLMCVSGWLREKHGSDQ